MKSHSPGLRLLVALLLPWLVQLSASAQEPAPQKRAKFSSSSFHGRESTLNVFGGTLCGRNHGEFGGSLQFEDRNGQISLLLSENIVDMFEMPRGVVVFTGLAHLWFDAGAIYLVRSTTRGRLEVKPLHRLPSAPSYAHRLDDGAIRFWVRTYSQDPRGVGSPASENKERTAVCRKLDLDFKVKPLPCPHETG